MLPLNQYTLHFWWILNVFPPRLSSSNGGFSPDQSITDPLFFPEAIQSYEIRKNDYKLILVKNTVSIFVAKVKVTKANFHSGGNSNKIKYTAPLV